MKKLFLCSCIFALTTCFFTACGGDDDVVNNGPNDGSVVINDDGTTSSGARFSPIDDKNFYLDYVKYSIVDAHIEVTGYDETAFNGVANIVKAVKLKGGNYEVLIVAKEAFKACDKLTSLTIPNCVTHIGSNAFEYSRNLKIVKIGNGVASLEHGVFRGCSALIAITIPNSVTEIGRVAFFKCSSLTSIIIPNNIVSIGSMSFWGCSSLKEFYCYSEKVPNTSPDAFGDCNLSKAILHVPASSIEAYQNSEGWKDFGSIVALADSDPTP